MSKKLVVAIVLLALASTAVWAGGGWALRQLRALHGGGARH
jgi:hypothetical protein